MRRLEGEKVRSSEGGIEKKLELGMRKAEAKIQKERRSEGGKIGRSAGGNEKSL